MMMGIRSQNLLPGRAYAGALRRMALVMIAFAFLVGCKASDEKGTSTILLEPCRLSGFDGEAKCGSFEVSEEPGEPSGRKLSLHIVLVPARASRPAPDPLFFLAGGPGQGASKVAGPVMATFQHVHRQRDIVFVDQRGTGESAPLKCREEKDIPLQERLNSEPDIEKLRECLSSLDANPALYTTPIAMDDLDRVREALGYEQINLYGGSYGSRAGLVYMRRHPEHVRAAILDGLAPTNMKLFLSFGRDGQRALDLLVKACAADEGCSERFPQLSQALESVLSRLEEEPEVTVVEPRTGVPTQVKLNRGLFVGGLRGILYHPLMASLIPQVITRAAQGDFNPFVAETLAFSEGLEATLSFGMMLSVVCAEDIPFITDEEIESFDRGHIFGMEPVTQMRQSCSVWPRGELPEDYRSPVVSDIPTLLLSGELDPVTPPVWGEEVAAHLSHGKHVVVPGTGHNAAGVGCVPRLMAEFLDAGSAEGLNTGCVVEQSRPPFFLDFAGTAP